MRSSLALAGKEFAMAINEGSLPDLDAHRPTHALWVLIFNILLVVFCCFLLATTMNRQKATLFLLAVTVIGLLFAGYAHEGLRKIFRDHMQRNIKGCGVRCYLQSDGSLMSEIMSAGARRVSVHQGWALWVPLGGRTKSELFLLNGEDHPSFHVFRVAWSLYGPIRVVIDDRCGNRLNFSVWEVLRRMNEEFPLGRHLGKNYSLELLFQGAIRDRDDARKLAKQGLYSLTELMICVLHTSRLKSSKEGIALQKEIHFRERQLTDLLHLANIE
jgi:hypothetical protein